MFESLYRGSMSRKHILGFREMLELCVEFSQSLPCSCDGDSLSFQEVADLDVSNKDLMDKKPPGQTNEVLRNFYCLEGQKIHSFLDPDDSTTLLEMKEFLEESAFSTQHGSKRQPASEKMALLRFSQSGGRGGWRCVTCRGYPVQRRVR